MNDLKQKIRPALMGLSIGQAVEFPISRLKSMRTQASELGAIYDRQFTTKMDRERRIVEVKRMS